VASFLKQRSGGQVIIRSGTDPARVLRALAGGLGRFLVRALAARDLDRLAARNFVAGIVRHPPEEERHTIDSR
jgi:hypothetical protein